MQDKRTVPELGQETDKLLQAVWKEHNESHEGIFNIRMVEAKANVNIPAGLRKYLFKEGYLQRVEGKHRAKCLLEDAPSATLGLEIYKAYRNQTPRKKRQKKAVPVTAPTKEKVVQGKLRFLQRPKAERIRLMREYFGEFFEWVENSSE